MGVFNYITGFGGREILRLVAGPRFEYAREFLFLLSIAAAIDVVGFGLEPFHNAHGRAGRVLRTYIVAALTYGALLAALIALPSAATAQITALDPYLMRPQLDGDPRRPQRFQAAPRQPRRQSKPPNSLPAFHGVAP